MNDKNTFTGSLMAGGILVWCVFTPDGRAPLHMNSEQHPDSRTHSLGGCSHRMFLPFMKFATWITGRCSTISLSLE